MEDSMLKITGPETREIPLSPKERAEARDSYVRSFEAMWCNWSNIAKVCLQVKADEDWKLLGHHSWDAWIIAAAPRSRPYIYMAISRYTELSPEMTDEELSKIPLGTAGILTKVSRSKRRDPAVKKAAEKKPAEFLKDIEQIAPEEHLESTHRLVLNFEQSAWDYIEKVYQKWQEVWDAPGASFEKFVEWMAAEQSTWSLHVPKDDEGRQDDTPGKRLQ